MVRLVVLGGTVSLGRPAVAAPATPHHGTVDLATRVQRRRDFTAHLTGFLSGALVLGVVSWRMPDLRAGALAALLTWSIALSFQHVRHVLRGPVTAADVAAEHARLTRSR
jgi:hypothetical protein